MPQHHDTPKLVFVHLLSTVTLYLTAIAFIWLSFTLINFYIPDVTDTYYTSLRQTMRVPLSLLIVMFPTYMGTILYLQKVYTENKEAREMKSRKWLIYLTLFIAILTILVACVVTLNALFGGELTVRFILKFASLLVVAGGIVGYYSYHLKQYAK